MGMTNQPKPGIHSIFKQVNDILRCTLPIKTKYSAKANYSSELKDLTNLSKFSSVIFSNPWPFIRRGSR